jgi:hypothetical protein
MKNLNQFKVEELSSKEKQTTEGGKWPSLEELVHDAVHILFGQCNGAESHDRK